MSRHHDNHFLSQFICGTVSGGRDASPRQRSKPTNASSPTGPSEKDLMTACQKTRQRVREMERERIEKDRERDIKKEENSGKSS